MNKITVYIRQCTVFTIVKTAYLQLLLFFFISMTKRVDQKYVLSQQINTASRKKKFILKKEFGCDASSQRNMQKNAEMKGSRITEMLP